MGIWAKMVEMVMGPEPTIQELFPVPKGMFDHKDHLFRCPECQKHSLCREIVCRLVCEKCFPTKKETL